jgi:hypothetical protein
MVRARMNPTIRLSSIALGCTAALLFGCPKEASEGGEKKAPPPKPTAAPKPVATSSGAAGALADPRCLAAFDASGPKKVVEVAGRSFEITGTKLVAAPKAGDVVLGVMSDIKEDTPENLANLDALVEFFKTEKAEAIVVAGDTGETQPQIEHALDTLAKSKLPIFVVIGNREGRAAYHGAVTAVAARYPGLFDMNQVRLAELGDAALVSVPGYYNKVYIHSEDGCDYKPSDVDATKSAVQAAAGKTVVLVSHGPPKQDGVEALDRTLEQANVGDPSLARFLKDAAIKFGIFANIEEAGGRATNLAGSQLVAQGKFVEELYLNAGPADSVKWKMNDGTQSMGMAGVLTIRGKQASFKIHRLPVK